MKAVLDTALRMGAQCICSEEGLYVQAPERPKAIPHITTAVYPGFPTDLQSAVLAVLGRADGTSIVEETVFENRFRIVEHLVKMGADIKLDGNRKVVINGVGHLCGKEVEARELRGGAALILAGLMADGETTVRGCSYVYRGYENICKDLRELGARIVSV
jgi:UDP-N-acetylglucosamine 1-carboxyvinyltransferase